MADKSFSLKKTRRNIIIIIATIIVFLIIAIAVRLGGGIRSESSPQPYNENIVVQTEQQAESSNQEYRLYREIADTTYVEGGKSKFFSLVDTKIDEKKVRDFMTEEGVLMAHKVSFSISALNNIDVYVVPSYKEYLELGTPNFRYYEECSGLSNECYISYYAGMIIINKENKIAKVIRNIRVYEPIGEENG